MDPILNKRDGKVTNFIAFHDAVELLPDGTYYLRKRPRTNLQNAYLHALFTSIAKDSGTEMEYIKYIMKKRFLTVHIYKYEHTKSTADLTTTEFAEFVDNVLNFIAELGYTYMTPEEYKKKHFIN